MVYCIQAKKANYITVKGDFYMASIYEMFDQPEMTYGEMKAFFDDLLSSKTRARKAYVYGAYLRDELEQKQRKFFENAYKGNCRAGDFYVAHIISEDLAVMERISRGSSLYTPCVLLENNEVQKGYYHYNTYEEALLGALSMKYSKSEEPVKYLQRIIGMPENYAEESEGEN